MISKDNCKWENTPKTFLLEENRVEIVTESHTDLWQKTYEGESADNAPMLLWETDAKTFSFSVKVSYESDGLYDQAGIVMHLNESTWLKGSMECEAGIKHLGSVVTNNGFSDWASVDVSVEKTTMWYRLNRKGDDFLLEYSEDGNAFSVLRMCHVWDIGEIIKFGVYACSPRESSFKAVFTDFSFTEN